MTTRQKKQKDKPLVDIVRLYAGNYGQRREEIGFWKGMVAGQLLTLSIIGIFKLWSFMLS